MSQEDRSLISDGYHTFSELYAHRAALFIALMKAHPTLAWRSKFHLDPEPSAVFEGWFVAGINLPTGQISYHLPLEMWDVCGFCAGEQPVFDGHTSDEVVTRLVAFSLRERT